MPFSVVAQVSTSPAVSPPISLGVSPHHAVLSGPDALFSESYCYLTEKDKTVSESYDLYYKGSLIDSLSRTCNAEATRNAVAIAAGAEAGDALTFSQLYQRFAHVGRGFAELGMHPNDRALIFMVPDSSSPTQWLLSCYGLWSHGMQPVLGSTAAQVNDAVRETRTRVIITTAAGAAVAFRALNENKIANAHVVIAGDYSAAAIEGADGIHVTSFADFEANGRSRHLDTSMTMPRPEPSQFAMIVYSSQTPGRGIVLTHGNLHAAITVTTPRLIALAGEGHALRTSIVEPLSHLTPFVLASACLIAGGSIAFGLDGVQAFGPTLVACTHTRYAAVVDSLGEAAGNRAVLQYNSPQEEHTDFSTHTDFGAGPGYWYSPVAVSGVGLMPLSSTATATLLPGTEMRFRHFDAAVDDKSPRLAEVMVRGPCVSKGYFIPNRELEELDRSVLCDGWMPTGDVAEISSGGDMRIVGRLGKSEST